MIRLSNIRLESHDGWSRLCCDLSSVRWGSASMYFELPDQYASYFSCETYDCFLAAILFPAMYYHEDIEICGAVSKKLFRNITPYVQAVLKDFCADARPVSITAQRLTIAQQRGNLVATGFSGGVDSFATFYDYFERESDPEYKINALFFFNVGSHGPFCEPDSYRKFLVRYEYLKTVPEEKGLPFIPLNSNVHLFHAEFGHQKTACITQACAVLAVETAVSRYYVSSAISYKNAKLFGSMHFNFSLGEFSESYLLPLLSTEHCALIPDGEQYTRCEKTQRIADYPAARQYLNVCVSAEQKTAGNCSRCPKCLRTLLALESLGALEEFSAVFDMREYKKHAFRYKCQERLRYRANPFAKDNVDFARAHGNPIPNICTALIVCLPHMAFSLAKKTARVLLGDACWQKLKRKVKHARAA